jgi:hypothetical protein
VELTTTQKMAGLKLSKPNGNLISLINPEGNDIYYLPQNTTSTQVQAIADRYLILSNRLNNGGHYGKIQTI